MKVYRDLSSDESRRFWKSVDAAADRVNQWPAWKRGDSQAKSPEITSPEKGKREQTRKHNGRQK